MRVLVLVSILALLSIISCESRIKKVYDPNIPCPPETLRIVVHDTVFVDKDDEDRPHR